MSPSAYHPFCRFSLALPILAAATGLLSACGTSPSPQTLHSQAVALQNLQYEAAAHGQARWAVDHHINQRFTSAPSAPAPASASEDEKPWVPLASPEPEYHTLHYVNSFEFPPESLTHPSFHGKTEITLQPSKAGFELMHLDSLGLKINQVLLINTMTPLRYEQKGEQIAIDLNRVYQPRETVHLLVDYDWDNSAPVADRGMYFEKRDGAAGVEAIYSDAETEKSRYWWPGNSHPNERATFESFITVPKPFVSISNGALLGVEDIGASTRYHWKLKMPMASYLFVQSSGKFAITEAQWNGIPLQYVGPSDDRERVAYTLRHTPDMLAYFTHLLDTPYPYEKYAQVFVPHYAWGGMEHTTATTLTDRLIHSPAEDAEFPELETPSHELAHQWFGDLVTCKSWDQIWLNEGFATYFASLYGEAKLGHDSFLKDLSEGAEWFYHDEETRPRPVVFPFIQESPDDLLDAHAYAKGAYFLHMLRGRIGDAAFFKGIHDYLARHRGKLVTTADLKTSIEEASGQKLATFFEQWLDKPGFPIFEVRYHFRPRASKLHFVIKQTQDTTRPGGVAGTTPYFEGPLPVEVDGKVYTLEIGPHAQQDLEFAIPKAPNYVAFNHEAAWLARVKMDQPVSAWRAQLAESPDPTARLAAVDALLEKSADWAGLDPVAHCVAHDRQAWVRAHCARVLTEAHAQGPAALGSPLPSWLAATARAAITDPDFEVRREGSRLAARLPADQAWPLLQERIQSDAQVTVIAAAIEALRDIAKPEARALLRAQLERPSFQERIRIAALAALATHAEAGSLPLAQEFVQPSYEESLRLQAMRLIQASALAPAPPASPVQDTARRQLEALLGDARRPVRNEAVAALAAIKSPASLGALQKIADSDEDPELRQAALAAIQKIRAG